MISYLVENIKDDNGTRFRIPLTENKLHDFTWYPGEGYFSVGVKGIDKDYIKAWVDKDDVINWSVLDECDKELPGNHIYEWPRFIYYTGNDTSFVTWSQTRKIESFTWKPLKSMEVDFSKSAIYKLFIYSDYKLTLNIGNQIKRLSLYGNPDNFVIEKCSEVPSLYFYPEKDKESKVYSFPIYPYFRDAKEIRIEVDPNGAPFDCSCLLQFPDLELLYLIGNMTNLHVLKKLKCIKQLGFWNVPDLSNLPTLDNWSNLDDFVALNIDENVGARLKNEVKEIKRRKKIGYASVTKLRNKLWFETEYCAPFAHWQETNRKKASREFKKCLKKVKDAQFEDDIKNAIIEFTNKMNCLENLESVERDDIYSALDIIMQNSPIEVDVFKWGEWFDETRDF